MSDSHGAHVEPLGILAIVVGIILSILMFGWFSDHPTKTSSTNSNVVPQVPQPQFSCGIAISKPTMNAFFRSGEHVAGTTGGCGWTISNAGELGTVTLYRYDNVQMGDTVPLTQYYPPSDRDYFMPEHPVPTAPYTFNMPYFITPGNAAVQEDGAVPGYFLFKSSSGANYMIPVTF